MTQTRALVALAREYAESRHWYTNARAEILRTVPATDADHLAALLAVTSPRCHVRLNVRRALAIYRHGPKVLGYRTLAIPGPLQTCIRRYLDTGEVRGLKINPFYRNLCGDLQPVTIDTHMARLLCSPSEFYSNGGPKRAAFYRSVETIATVSRVLRWHNAETQAALWYASMRQQGLTPVSFASVIAHYRESAVLI